MSRRLVATAKERIAAFLPQLPSYVRPVPDAQEVVFVLVGPIEPHIIIIITITITFTIIIIIIIILISVFGTWSPCIRPLYTCPRTEALDDPTPQQIKSHPDRAAPLTRHSC